MGLAEHLGLIPPQICLEPGEPTSFMRAAPHQNEDETGSPEDDAVADPLSDATVSLWDNTARKNREIFTEIFRPVPTNLVRDWPAYEVRCMHSMVCSSGDSWPTAELLAESQDGPCRTGYHSRESQTTTVSSQRSPRRMSIGIFFLFRYPLHADAPLLRISWSTTRSSSMVQNGKGLILCSPSISDKYMVIAKHATETERKAMLQECLRIRCTYINC